MTERGKKRNKKSKAAMLSSSVEEKNSGLTEEQAAAKSKADEILKELLKEHKSWIRDQGFKNKPDSASFKLMLNPYISTYEAYVSRDSDKRKLTWNKLNIVFQLYKDAGLGCPDLTGINLSYAGFHNTKIPPGTSFAKAILNSTDFEQSILSEVDFSECSLVGSDFNFTKMDKCIFTNANISHSDFINSSAINCDFSSSRFNQTRFAKSKLNDSSLEFADLHESDLSECSAVNTDFTNSNLCGCKLNEANFTNAILTGAKLYGTSRFGWNIEGVKCDYAYWDSEGKERFPPENNLKEGEFTTQYRPYKEFSYNFKEGITPLDLMLATHIVNEINSSDIGFTIKIDNASLRGLNPTLNFIMESGEANRDEAKELFKTVYEHKISLLEEKLQNSAQLLEERTRRTDLAEEQLAEMTAVVKQTFSGEKFGINARQLLVEHLFSPIMEEVFRDDGLIARHVSRKLRNIADFKADDLAQYRYVALFGPGKYADAIPKHDLDLMHACLSNFMKGDCLFVTESELMNTPENSYIRSVYRCFGDHPENEAYVAVATIFRGINDKILKQPVYCELNRKQHGSWDEALNHALERLRTALFMKSLEDFQLKPLPSAKKSLVCPNGSRIRELRNQKVGPMGRACKIKIFREGRVPHVLSKTTLIKAEKGEPITKARLRDVAKVLKVAASRLIFENIVPNRERLKELRAAVFCTEEELLEQFGVSTPIFFSMLEEAKVVPADTLRYVHHHYKQLIGSMADPFSELIDHSATEALVERLQRGSQSVK